MSNRKINIVSITFIVKGNNLEIIITKRVNIEYEWNFLVIEYE